MNERLPIVVKIKGRNHVIGEEEIDPSDGSVTMYLFEAITLKEYYEKGTGRMFLRELS